MEAIVDRIEGDIAVLEVDGQQFMDVPLSDLPGEVHQGDVFTGEPGVCGEPGTWQRDDARKIERLKANQALLDELFG